MHRWILLLAACIGLGAPGHAETNVGPVTMLMPGFTVRELPVKLSNINNLRFAPDGSLTALGYDAPYIRNALKRIPAAWRGFESLAPSHRRRYVGWIHTAKQQETRVRRLDETIRLLAAGKRLGLK